MDPPPSATRIRGKLVVGKTYDLVLWIVQKVEKFLKSYRFSVGQRLSDTALDLRPREENEDLRDHDLIATRADLIRRGCYTRAPWTGERFD